MAEGSNEKSLIRSLMAADTMNAVATLLLVIVGVVGVFYTSRTIELSERAWLNTAGVQLTRNPIAGEPLYYSINVANSGKEPALDIAIVRDFAQTQPPLSRDLTTIKVPENTTCDGIAPIRGSAVITPNGAMNNTNNTGTGAHQVRVDDAFLHGEVVIVIEGCVAYRTFNRVHHTAFCQAFFMASPLPPEKPANDLATPLSATTVTAVKPTTVESATKTQPVASETKLTLASSICPGGNAVD